MQNVEGFDPWEVVDEGVLRLIHTDIEITRSTNGTFVVSWRGVNQVNRTFYDLNLAKKSATDLCHELVIMGHCV